MPYSFLLSSDDPDQQQIAAVRDEIDDVTNAASPVEGRDYFLSDDRIAARLVRVAAEATTDENRVLLASASCLDTLATNQAYVLKKKETMEEQMDGPAVADSIRKHATALRNRVANSVTQAPAAPVLSSPSSGAVVVQTYYSP